jgi:hypothetical protein
MIRKTYINCGTKHQEIIAFLALLGIVKVKWTNNTDLAGFVAFFSLLLIPLSGVFTYITWYISSLFLPPLEFGWIAGLISLTVIIGGFWFWTKRYFEKHWVENVPTK